MIFLKKLREKEPSSTVAYHLEGLLEVQENVRSLLTELGTVYGVDLKIAAEKLVELQEELYFHYLYHMKELRRPLKQLVDATWDKIPPTIYLPQGWDLHEKGWIRGFDGVRLTTRGVTILIGDAAVVSTFDVTNLAGDSLALGSAKLLAKGGAYVAELPGVGEAKLTVESGSTRSISLSWKLENFALEVLGEQPTVILNFVVADESRPIEITFTKSAYAHQLPTQADPSLI